VWDVATPRLMSFNSWIQMFYFATFLGELIPLTLRLDYASFLVESSTRSESQLSKISANGVEDGGDGEQEVEEESAALNSAIRLYAVNSKELPPFPRPYFTSAFAGLLFSAVLAYLSSSFFPEKAQPSSPSSPSPDTSAAPDASSGARLFYITVLIPLALLFVPAAVLGCAAFRGEVRRVLGYTEVWSSEKPAEASPSIYASPVTSRPAGRL